MKIEKKCPAGAGANDSKKNRDKDSSDVPTSDGLRDSQSRSTSVREQPSRSSEKMILYFFLSVFLNMIIGPALYNLDVYSENFSEELINIPQDRDECKQYFDNEFNKVILECKGLSNMNEKCRYKLEKIKKIGEACFQEEITTGDNQGERIDAEETTQL